jgi:hypothetical protein
VPTIFAAIAVIGISIARQQTRTVALMRLRFKVGSNPAFLRRGNGAQHRSILLPAPEFCRPASR